MSRYVTASTIRSVTMARPSGPKFAQKTDAMKNTRSRGVVTLPRRALPRRLRGGAGFGV
jgi:hypothetical protein